MKADLERALRSIAEEVPPTRQVPPGLLPRARRRIALTLSVTLMALSAIGIGTYAAIQAANSPRPPKPAATGATPVPSPSATPSPPQRSPSPVWAELRNRPLTLPVVAPGAACQVTGPFGLPPNRIMPRQVWSEYAGPGPVFVGGYLDHGTVHWKEDIPVTRGWHPVTILWLADRAARGAILVRGRQIDGSHGIRFGGLEGIQGASPALAEGHLVPSNDNQQYLNPGLRPTGWHLYAATLFFRTPGCYGVQMDGDGFSEVVVFRAGP